MVFLPLRPEVRRLAAGLALATAWVLLAVVVIRSGQAPAGFAPLLPVVVVALSVRLGAGRQAR